MFANAYFIEVSMTSLIPRTVPDWLRRRFSRFNGSPKEIEISEIMTDATFDLKIHFKGTKNQLIKAIENEIHFMLTNGELKKSGSTYIGDFIHPLKDQSSPVTEKKQEKQKQNSRVQNVMRKRRRKAKPASGNQLFLKSLGD